MLKIWFICGGLFGFLAVAFGAFGEHGLSKKLAPELLNIFGDGVRYQMYHALALIAVAIIELHTGQHVFDIAAWAFVVGILLFSGSVYMRALTGMKWLSAIAPLGGILLLIGWGWFIYQVIVIRLP